MSLDVPHLIAPRELPDGSVSWEETQPEIGARLRNGDPTLGWIGDERLSLVLNRTHCDTDPEHRPRWEVWRRHEDGSSSLVCHRVAHRIDGNALIRNLAKNDTRTRDLANEMLEARKARQDRASKETQEFAEGHADKLAWALGKDLGLPAQSGRLYPLSAPTSSP